MANKRTIKRNITAICGELFAECVAMSLYDTEVDKQNIDALIQSIIGMQSEYVCRVSHVEPGMPAKAYFADLKRRFNEDLQNIVDQINNLH